MSRSHNLPRPATRREPSLMDDADDSDDSEDSHDSDSFQCHTLSPWIFGQNLWVGA